MVIEEKSYPFLKSFIEMQLLISPDQEKFLRRRFQTVDAEELEFLEELARLVRRLEPASEKTLYEDYAWLCAEQVKEELHFRRQKTYRLTSFEQAVAEVYSNATYMTRYMNGLLLSQLWWSNHTSVLKFYRDTYLAGLPSSYSHLEIGPGHGLFLYFAAHQAKAGTVTGWDISPASVQLTAKALRKLGLRRMPNLELQNMFSSPVGEFDSVVFSEVLEHMEKPRDALDVIRTLLSKRGRLFLNMPINSPAPDHLFNVDTPENLEKFIVQSGFQGSRQAVFPRDEPDPRRREAQAADDFMCFHRRTRVKP